MSDTINSEGKSTDNHDTSFCEFFSKFQGNCRTIRGGFTGPYDSDSWTVNHNRSYGIDVFWGARNGSECFRKTGVGNAYVIDFHKKGVEKY
jgi:hypothetical protein